MKKDKNIIVDIVVNDELFVKIIKDKFESTTDYKIRTYLLCSDFIKELKKTIFTKYHHHIVILDYFISSEDGSDLSNGLEILKFIKETDPNIVVIMLSEKDEVEAASAATRIGAISFIKKNENSFMRIHNNIKWAVSERNLKRLRSQSRAALHIFLTIIVVIIIVVFIIYYFN